MNDEITIPKALFDDLIEDAISLRAYARNMRELDALDARIGEAVKIRDNSEPKQP